MIDKQIIRPDSFISRNPFSLEKLIGTWKNEFQWPLASTDSWEAVVLTIIFCGAPFSDFLCTIDALWLIASSRLLMYESSDNDSTERNCNIRNTLNFKKNGMSTV